MPGVKAIILHILITTQKDTQISNLAIATIIFSLSTSSADSFRLSALESTDIDGSIGRIKADDPDVGENAEMEYSIVGGHDIFDIITDQATQEGVIIVKEVNHLHS